MRLTKEEKIKKYGMLPEPPIKAVPKKKKVIRKIHKAKPLEETLDKEEILRLIKEAKEKETPKKSQEEVDEWEEVNKLFDELGDFSIEDYENCKIENVLPPEIEAAMKKEHD